LSNTAGARDYWEQAADLESYDVTFGRRIAWKWDEVLQWLKALRWSPPGGRILDWGCGTGVASRTFLSHFPGGEKRRVILWDRSVLATQFAARQLRSLHPHLEVETGEWPLPDIDILLVSHVLGELDSEARRALIATAHRASTILWVEPGSNDSSRVLIAVREELRPSFSVLAPCTHQSRCPLLEASQLRHWCHQFATPPLEVFTEGDWAQFARTMGIDLRSLPLSCLVLDKRVSTVDLTQAIRVIGRPRFRKGHALIFGCGAAGVGEKRLTQRHCPQFFRQMRKNKIGSLLHWQTEGGEILNCRTVHPPGQMPESQC
jgi:ribosomal protein RSM22 (predicted rRNA methylase)